MTRQADSRSKFRDRARTTIYAFTLLPFCLTILFSPIVYGIDLKVGQVTLNTPTPVTGDFPVSLVVTFPITFSSVPAVFVLPDDTNNDPATLRVHSVTTNGFEIFVSEAEGEDATNHPPQDFNYLAIEPGTYTLASGDVIEVGIATGITDYQSGVSGGDSFFTQAFSSTASTRYGSTGAPSVITEIQSLNSDTTLLTGVGSSFTRTTAPWLETVQDGATTTSVDIALTRAETSAGSISGSGEDIAWLAIDSGADTTLTDDSAASIELKSTISSNSITQNCTSVNFPSSFSTSNPIAFASMDSTDGGDGGWMRECGLSASSVSLFVQEDTANDTDTAHTTEVGAVVAFSSPFVISSGTPMVVSSDTIPAGTVGSSSLSFTSVNFPEPMSATPLVFALPTDEDPSPATVRVNNVGPNGFDITQVHPSSGTGAGPSMTVDFIAIVPGDHTLPDGTRLVAGEANVSQFQGGATGGGTSWNTTAVSFSPAFDNEPAVLFGIQSFNSDPTFDPSFPAVPFMSVASRNKSTSGIDVALDFVKTSAGAPPSTEQVGYLAAEPVESTIKVIGGSLLEYKILNSPTTIEGVDDGCDSISYVSAFSSASSPRVVANRNTRNGGDGGWLRRCSLTSSAVGLQVDEDETGGSNRSHGADELAGIFAFENNFDWSPPVFEHTKTSVAEWDPVNEFVNAKSIPGAYQLYSLKVTNPGRIEADAIVLSDSVPANSRLFVGDLDGAGCPFDFNDGSDPSGLALTCAPGVELLSSSPPCVSVDNYCPYSDFSFANDWDSSTITDFRINLNNAFTSSDGSTEPEFVVQFRVRIE